MGIFKTIGNNMAKRKQIKIDGKIKIAQIQADSDNLAYQNGVTPAAHSDGKWAGAVNTGLGIVKNFLGQKNPDPLPLPDESSSPNKMVMVAGGVLVVGGILYFITKKKG